MEPRLSSRSRLQVPISRSLAIIGAIVVAEPLAATLLFPFVYYMVRGFDSVEEQYVGFWAGLITSAFFLPQMLTATIWGMLSDRLGRKPVMLIGLLGSAACMFLFGLAKSLAWAVITRGLCGLFNGNAGVARTAVGELAHNNRLNQGKAFSLFGFCSAIGYVIGPLLGGFLSNSAERFAWRGPADLFTEYRYLFPCLVSGCYNIFVLIGSWLLLEETNQNQLDSVSTPRDARRLGEGDEEDMAEQEPLLEEREGYTAGVHSKRTTIYCILGIVCISFHAIIFDEIYAVFAATSGGAGLHFASGDIAFSLSLMGPVISIAQLVLFPLLNKHFSAIVLWRASAAVFAAVYPIFSLLPQTSITAQWAALLALLCIRFTANVVAYTSMAVLLNQVALPENRGAIMGLGQTAISLGRAVGPAAGGSVWSWSLGNGLGPPLDFHFIFFIEFFLAIAQFLSSVGISVKG